MERSAYSGYYILPLVLLIYSISGFAQSSPRNSISGFVYDADRRPLPEVFVELQNDVYSTLKRVRTDGSGRFSFNGISSGVFKVKVLPYGTNYLEETQDVSIVNYTRTTPDNVYLDIYLKLDKRKVNLNNSTVTGVVFAQNVPQDAQNYYKKALSQLEKGKETDIGFENLKKAIEIFPTYYDALNRLGVEYVQRSKFQEAVPYLIESIKVNQRSYSSFFALGLAAYNLKHMKEAAEAFRATTLINPSSVYAQLQYGMILRINGNLKEAEQVLLKAKSLDKNLDVSDISWQLALLYEKTNRFNEAADELERYLQLQPDAPNIRQIQTLISQLRSKSKK